MLISVCLVQSKYIKIRFKYFSPIRRNVSESFCGFCRQTISRMYIIFNAVHAMPDMNNTYQFQDILKIFTRVRSRSDRQTKCINTF